MPYIDEDLLYNELDSRYKVAKGEARETYSTVLDILFEMLRADVAPRSEVDKLVIELEAMRGAANSYKRHYENAKAEVAREIFDEIKKVLNQEFTDLEQRRKRITDCDALDSIDGQLCGLDLAICIISDLREEYVNVKQNTNGV